MQLSVSRILASLMELGCADYKYTEGPGVPPPYPPLLPNATDFEVNVAVQREAPFIASSDLKLSDALAQYQQTLEVFSWEKIVGLCISLLSLYLCKFSYQISGVMHMGSDYRLMERIAANPNTDSKSAVTSGDISPDVSTNNALAISFAGYLFGMGTILTQIRAERSRRAGNGLGFDTTDYNTSNNSTEDQIAIDLLWTLLGELYAIRNLCRFICFGDIIDICA